MKKFLIIAIGLLAAGVALFGWRFLLRPRRLSSATAPPAQVAVTNSPPQPQPASAQPAAQDAPPQTPAAGAAPAAPPKHFGPFAIAGQNFTVDLETKSIKSSDENGDTVTSMEIRDAAGAVQYRRTFTAAEEKDYFESWSVSALLLSGTNGTGLLLNYDVYSEPSAPEEEPTSWFQVFGVLNGKLVPFGAPLEVQGGLLDEYTKDKTYKAARPLGMQADAFEFKVWTGHCRMVFPLRVDWALGKLSPAQECAKISGQTDAGCQYRVLPEDQLSTSGDVTFVRLWPNPQESGSPMKTVVKKDSKVDLLMASVPTQWTEGKALPPGGSKGLADEAGGFGVAQDSDLWLKVRIDGKEGWMHSEEDFRALGLPEDE
jgi:hypothetical protein